MENLRVVLWFQGVFSFFYYSMPVILAQYRGEIGLFYNHSFAPDLFYMFSITNFMFLLVKILPMLLFGLALFISLLLRHFSDFLGLQSRSKFIITSLNIIVFFTVVVILTYNLWHVFYLIKLSGDIEESPGPKLNSSQKLSICHWNLNSIAAHNFIKVSLLIAYNSIDKYEFNTFLDNLESNLETASFSNPFLTILIGDFNAKCAS